MWVDHVFSGRVINGIYHFHASSSAFAEFWNDIPIAQVTKNAFILETMESSSVLKTILVLNALINTKKLQIESQVMTLLLYLVLMKIIKCLLL